MQSNLITAEVLEACRVPPPKRNEWYLVLYVTNANVWRFYNSSGNQPDRFLTEKRAEEVIAVRSLRDARIVRIPGEGT